MKIARLEFQFVVGCADEHGTDFDKYGILIKVKFRYGAFECNFPSNILHVLKQWSHFCLATSPWSVILEGDACYATLKVLLCLLAGKMVNCRFLVPTINLEG